MGNRLSRQQKIRSGVVFKPQASMLAPIQCFLYSCCRCTWFVPISEQGSASETIICCRAGGSEYAWGSVYSPWSCSVHQGHRAGSCWKHHIPSTARVNTLNCSGEVWEPSWHLCLGHPTCGMEECVVPAPPAAVVKGSWGQERRWVWWCPAPAPVPGQNSVLHQHSAIHQFVGLDLGLGSPPSQPPAAPSAQTRARRCQSFSLLPGTAKSRSAEAECT